MCFTINPSDKNTTLVQETKGLTKFKQVKASDKTVRSTDASTLYYSIYT